MTGIRYWLVLLELGCFQHGNFLPLQKYCLGVTIHRVVVRFDVVLICMVKFHFASLIFVLAIVFDVYLMEFFNCVLMATGSSLD